MNQAKNQSRIENRYESYVSRANGISKNEFYEENFVQSKNLAMNLELEGNGVKEMNSVRDVNPKIILKVKRKIKKGSHERNSNGSEESNSSNSNG